MALSEFTFRLLLLFTPGIVCGVLVEALAMDKRWSPFRLVLYSFVLGVLCYVGYATLLHMVRASTERWAPGHLANLPPRSTILHQLMSGETRVGSGVIAEILIALALAFPIALGVSAALNHKWLHRGAQRLGVTKRFGDGDVWAFVFNSDISPWVLVRDLEHDLVYDGYVSAFSDTVSTNELLLKEVRVLRNSTWQELYTVGALYLTREHTQITLEFYNEPGRPPGQSAARQETA